MSHEYIYLLQEREFIKTNENIYKIGKTQQSNLKRFNSYPKGSVLLIQITCSNCKKAETELINLFSNKYKKRNDIGREYFEGNYKQMINDIVKITTDDIEYFEENNKNIINETIKNDIEIEYFEKNHKDIINETTNDTNDTNDNNKICEEIYNVICNEVYNDFFDVVYLNSFGEVYDEYYNEAYNYISNMPINNKNKYKNEIYESAYFAAQLDINSIK